MRKTEANESVFPDVQPVPQFNSHTYGLTKHEYFAGLAMQAIITRVVNESSCLQEKNFKYYGTQACKLAEALIEALNKEQS